MIKGTPLFGFGVNDANYPVNITTGEGKLRKIVWRCPYYQKWVNMLDRVYGNSNKPSYENTCVCDEWANFTNFKMWMEQQDWFGKELDKDLKGDGSLYGPDTCVFVSKKVNKLLHLKTPIFYQGYWQASVRLPNKTRVKLRRKDRQQTLTDYIMYKSLAANMLSESDCPDGIRQLINKKLTAFYEENL